MGSLNIQLLALYTFGRSGLCPSADPGRTNPHLSTAVTISKEGKILAAGSEDYKGVEGADVSNQEAVAKLIGAEDPDPIFSSPFQTVEGFEAVAVMYPIYSKGGEFLGGISATFEPAKVIRVIVSPWMNETGRSFWIMETGGLTAYEMDASQIGKNLFKDPLYKLFPSLIAFGRKIASERSGHGSYDFQVTEANKNVVVKDAYWTTAGLHGNEWRLCITEIRD